MACDQTEPLRLRQWHDSDLEPFARMNSDVEVMRFFPRILSREESLTSMERQRELIAERGWGLWVVEIGGQFAGFTGLSVPAFSAKFTPCVEIGWRFRTEFWGKGFAYRAAIQAMQYGFERLKLAEIVSFTAVSNERSQNLMRRLGMIRDANSDFDHPSISPGHPLQRHVFYRLRQADFNRSPV